MRSLICHARNDPCPERSQSQACAPHAATGRPASQLPSRTGCLVECQHCGRSSPAPARPASRPSGPSLRPLRPARSVLLAGCARGLVVRGELCLGVGADGGVVRVLHGELALALHSGLRARPAFFKVCRWFAGGLPVVLPGAVEKAATTALDPSKPAPSQACHGPVGAQHAHQAQGPPSCSIKKPYSQTCRVHG